LKKKTEETAKKRFSFDRK